DYYCYSVDSRGSQGFF
nr:immunoglobulin light chain junction region [Macaca mulatta]MOW04124.1 immunoglobulin light chain junction region [Macaca mulatta]MOW04397.1 immunoglobulin light chain junction region [Macaca mulatta]MOW04400.1 immunoglobulin light chain junction region [Macaca mulatta]MOW04651.1 immunoglobulin light chain junction region [Macaca mulatta]